MADVVINSIPDLLAFASGQYGYGSSSAYLSVELGADLDFADYDDTYSFAGCPGDWYLNFDGKGHKIDNIQYAGTADWGFIKCGSGLVNILNLSLTNLYVVTTGSVGGIYFSDQSFGGVSIIQNCRVSGQLEGTNYVCGISRNLYKIFNISYSSFSGTLKSRDVVCGICCNMNYNSTIVSNCMANATLTAPWCMCLSGARTTAINCEYRGTITASTAIIAPVKDNATGVNCILVINEDSTAPYITSESNVTVSNTYVDATKLAQTGISHPSYITEATTAQLKDAAWLKSKGFAL